jgi:hypothetical protein
MPPTVLTQQVLAQKVLAQKVLTPKVLTGGCQCGAVRYALESMPEGAHLCHCRMCQKAVGGPFAALAPVRLAHFRWTRGTPGRFDSSNLAYRDHCTACGTPLSFGYHGKDWIDVTIGSLDEPDLVPPVREYGIESRLAWCVPSVLNALPGQDITGMMSGQKVTVISHQHPDHDTPDGWTRNAGP